MNKWIAVFDLEYGDTMPDHMDLNYMGAKIDFHCRPMWIPVSKRLPEDGTYLVTLERIYDGEPIIDMRSFAKDLNKVDEFDFPKHKCGWYDYDSEYGYWEDTRVIAWMPLPEPTEKARAGMNNFEGTLELKSPLTKECWDKLADVELENTERIWFTTPSEKRVEYIKADVLDKISAEIVDFKEKCNASDYLGCGILEIIDKHKGDKE